MGHPMMAPWKHEHISTFWTIVGAGAILALLACVVWAGILLWTVTP